MASASDGPLTRLPAAFHSFRQKGCEVDDLQLRPCLPHPVVEHHSAERTPHRKGVGACAYGLTHAFLIDRPATLFLHEHACSAGAAAEGPLPVARHLNGLS